jgi:hypothetical protein
MEVSDDGSCGGVDVASVVGCFEGGHGEGRRSRGGPRLRRCAPKRKILRGDSTE